MKLMLTSDSDSDNDGAMIVIVMIVVVLVAVLTCDSALEADVSALLRLKLHHDWGDAGRTGQLRRRQRLNSPVLHPAALHPQPPTPPHTSTSTHLTNTYTDSIDTII